MTLSPTSSRGSGGSAAPETREELFGNAVSVANAASGALTWDTSIGPDSLLTLTVPSLPTVITAGVYAVTIDVVASVSMTADGYFEVFLHLDNTGFNQATRTDTRLATAAGPTPRLSLALAWYCPAGSQIRADVFNRDGAATRTFALDNASVQRLS